MFRTNIYLSDQQCSALSTRARAENTSRAELIRRLLDRALIGNRDDVTADLAAIEESFGVLHNEPIVIDRQDGERGAHLKRIAAL
jgi:hypothetical protein